MCKKYLRLIMICFVALFVFGNFALAVDQSQLNRNSLLQQLINFFIKNGRGEIASTISVNGVCGPLNGTVNNLANKSESDFCSAGISASIIAPAGTWSCNGLNGGTTVNCSISPCSIKTLIADNNGVYKNWAYIYQGSQFDSQQDCLNAEKSYLINGVCGSEDGKNLQVMPRDLCKSGMASNISGTGPWTWTCSGQNGGTTASCSANKIDYLCSTLWWLDSGNKTCQSAKQFCGAYMYQGLKTFNSQQECLNIAKTDAGINFKEKDVAICKEDDKPIIYYFGSTGCSHCQWETPIFDSVVNSFGSYISYHKNIDNSDDQDIFEQYSTGGIPTIVLGCKYYRIGSGERAGEEAEKAGLKKLICSLTNNQPASVCQSQTYICTEIYNPVCGSDGKTYSNSCKATNAGVSVAYKGECGQTTINTSVGTITTSKPLGQMNRQELINFIMILIEALSKKQ